MDIDNYSPRFRKERYMNWIHILEGLQEPFACVVLLMEVTRTSPVVSNNVSANDSWFHIYKEGCIQIQAC
jgi:hypothetical protein